jgi:hypothetical protein
MKFTDEFRALLSAREEKDDDAKTRVIGAVMQRIQQTAAPQDTVVDAIRRMAWPVALTSVLAASLVIAIRVAIDNSSLGGVPAPSTAQAMGLAPDLVRWSEARDRAPQLVELMTASSLADR